MLSFRHRFKASLTYDLSKALKLFATHSNIPEMNSNESER